MSRLGRFGSAWSGTTPGPRRRLYMIMATQRSGSTLLCQLLDAHPELLCPGELFQPNRPLNRLFNGSDDQHQHWPSQRAVLQAFYQGDTILRHLRPADDLAASAAAAAQIHVLGFKHMYNNAAPAIRPQLVQWLADHEVAVVHLVRLNRLEQFLSDKTARARNKFTEVNKEDHGYKKRYNFPPHVTAAASDSAGPAPSLPLPDASTSDARSGPSPGPAAVGATEPNAATAVPVDAWVSGQVDVDWDEFEFMAQRQEDAAAWFRMAFLTVSPPLRYLEISYEALQQPQLRAHLLRTLYAFVQADDVDYQPASLDVGLRRTNTRTCAERVANWDVIRANLSSTFPHMLQLCEGARNLGGPNDTSDSDGTTGSPGMQA